MGVAMDLHDGVVDGAEIEATLVNTEKIINWTCQIEGMMSTEFQGLQTDIAASETTISTQVQATEAALIADAETKFTALQSALVTEAQAVETRVQANVDTITAELEARMIAIHDLLATLNTGRLRG